MKCYVLKIELKETNIWRKIAVPAGYNFHELHEIIQIVFGWENYHLHEYQIGKLVLAAEENEDVGDFFEDFKYESDVNLDLILLNVKKFTYIYDFGDWWEHDVEVEEIIDCTSSCPQLLDFGGTMVVEDCHDGEILMKRAKRRTVNKDEINSVLSETFD